MELPFTKYYEHFYKKIEYGNYADIWEKDLKIRENTYNSKYGCLSIEIVGNNLCQLKCKHCYLGDINNNKPGIIINSKIIKSIIDQAAIKINGKQLFSQIAFLGGEPTLHPDILDLIIYAKKKGLDPIIITNGLKFIDLSLTKKFINTKAKIIMHLPFQPVTPQGISTQNTICNNSSYAQLLLKSWDNIFSVKYDKDQIFGNFVISKLSIDYAYETYLFCRAHNINPFFEKMRLSNDKSYNKKYILSSNEIIKLTKKIFKFDYDNGFIENSKYSKDISLLSYFTTPIIGRMCTSFKTGLYIQCNKDNVFGNCFSCCGQTISHGNIFLQPLSKIMKQKKNFKIFQNINKYIEYPCNKCFIMKIGLCNGGCRGDANVQYGSPSAPYPQCVFINRRKKYF